MYLYIAPIDHIIRLYVGYDYYAELQHKLQLYNNRDAYVKQYVQNENNAGVVTAKYFLECNIACKYIAIYNYAAQYSLNVYNSLYHNNKQGDMQKYLSRLFPWCYCDIGDEYYSKIPNNITVMPTFMHALYDIMQHNIWYDNNGQINIVPYNNKVLCVSCCLIRTVIDAINNYFGADYMRRYTTIIITHDRCTCDITIKRKYN